MKLKSLAALIFRIVGALFLLGGIGNAAAVVIANRTPEAMWDCMVLLVIGFCSIRFSKKLAGLFCSGLDDEVA